MNTVLSALRSLLPKALQRWLIRRSRLPRIGTIDAGDLRRVKPFSTAWGNDRGMPVDRHYIACFLARYSADVRGRVLEIGDNSYTPRFRAERVAKSECYTPFPVIRWLRM